MNELSKKQFFMVCLLFRPVRDDDGETTTMAPPTKTRPLYEIPYMFEAREFLRKKLIGKKVHTCAMYTAGIVGKLRGSHIDADGFIH